MYRSLTRMLVLVVVATPTVVNSQTVWEKALDAIPGDAMGFVCIPHIKHLDTNYQSWLNTLGLQMFVPATAQSLLSMIKQNAPMFGGLNEEAPLILVLLPVQGIGDFQTKVAVLVPTKDPSAMIAAMNGVEGEDGVWAVNIMGSPAQAVSTKGFVILSMSPDTAKAVRDRKSSLKAKFKAADIAVFKDLDFAVWIDAQQVLSVARPLIDMLFLPMMMSQNTLESKAAAIQKKQLDMFMNGMASLTVGVAAGQTGIGLRFGFTFVPESDLAKQMLSTNSSRPLLRGLVAEEYLLAFGQVFDSNQMKQLVDSLDGYMSLAEDSEEIDEEQFQELRKTIRSLLPLVSGLRFVIDAPKHSDGGLISLSVVVDTSDSAKWVELFGRLAEQGETFIATVAKNSGQDVEEVQLFRDAVAYQSNAETLGGVSVSHLKIDLEKIVDAGEADADDLSKLRKVLGQEGLMLRIAAADAKTVVVSLGGGKAHFQRLLTHAKSNESPLEQDPGIRKVAANLSDKKSFEMYLAVDHFFAAIERILKALGEDGLPFAVPQLDAPIGMSATNWPGGTRSDIFFPTELIVGVKNAVMMAGMQGDEESPEEDDDESAEE